MGTQGQPACHTLASTTSELGLPLDDVVILMAANERFAGYLSVALQSIVEHASRERRYDIVVLTNDLTAESTHRLIDQVSTTNVGIGFLDVEKAMGDVKLPRHGHFSRETYYRLLAPELLDNVTKAIYLDCDLVVMRDLAELWDTDLTGYLIGATHDADTCGQADGYDTNVDGYLRREVGLDDPHDYFQAGVLVMNLEEFRRTYPSAHMLEVAASRHWHWLDQDVLNHLCRGRVRYVPMNWNALIDWQRLRRTHIVAQTTPELVAAYEDAHDDPWVIHYAGPDDRPWYYPRSDYADVFWDYARRCPWHEELLSDLEHSRRSLKGVLKRLWVWILYRILMPALDLVFWPGSPHRAVVIDIYTRLGAQKL